MPKGNGVTIPEWRPGLPSVWLVIGSSGHRVIDNPAVIAAKARMLMVERGEVAATVHAGGCGLGKVDASMLGMVKDRPIVGRCTCTPQKIWRYARR